MKVVVGKVSDFRNGDRKIIDVNGKSIGIFCVDGHFYAIRNRCPHQWGPLCLGDFAPRAVSSGPGDVHLDSGPPLIACPWHGWEYDLATGQSFMGPGRGNMAALSYEVSVLPGSQLAREPGELAREPDGSARQTTAPGGRPRADGRVPGPYVAETMPVSVEQDYVVIDDSPVRGESLAAGGPPVRGESRESRGRAAKEAGA